MLLQREARQDDGADLALPKCKRWIGSGGIAAKDQK